MTKKIAVLGSLNLDTTYHVTRFPQPGETISANDKSSAPGGKGAEPPITPRQARRTSRYARQDPERTDRSTRDPTGCSHHRHDHPHPSR